uniref:Uncharacterized protein n=1 Tax=Lotus japonicus TaxID=34305 RepID=I3T9D6_LOTJA|nr:unknown [Lotus japonicus]
MACRGMLVVEPFPIFQRFCLNLNPNNHRRTFKFNPRPFQFHGANGGGALRCSHDETPSFQDDQGGPPQEAVLKAISEVSKTEGRVGQTTNMVIGGTVTDDSTNEWLALDQKVNSYPTNRGFLR